MMLECPRCATKKEPHAMRNHAGPFQDRYTKEWIAKCDSCGAGQVVDAPHASVASFGVASDIGDLGK